jgi:hypothetical protein
VLKSELSETRGFHTLAQTTAGGCHNASLDHCRGEWTLDCSNSFARRVSIITIHGIVIESNSGSLNRAIIALKSRDGLCGSGLRALTVVLSSWTTRRRVDGP